VAWAVAPCTAGLALGRYTVDSLAARHIPQEVVAAAPCMVARYTPLLWLHKEVVVATTSWILNLCLLYRWAARNFVSKSHSYSEGPCERELDRMVCYLPLIAATCVAPLST
jgi:hypothetical protein